MRSFRACENEIWQRIQAAPQLVLMLDFDGTLAPIVSSPGRAKMSARLAARLDVCARHIPTAIISGRHLDDLRKRIGTHIACAGNHGSEWSVGTTDDAITVSAASSHALRGAREAIVRVLDEYSQARLEDKGPTFSVHYRSLLAASQRRFVRSIRRALAPFRDHLRIDHNLATFEIRPIDAGDKGTCGRRIFNHFSQGKDAVPIYIGDGVTDEDAFREFSDGITIRVGRGSRSASRYYFKQRSDVDAFIEQLMRVRGISAQRSEGKG